MNRLFVVSYLIVSLVFISCSATGQNILNKGTITFSEEPNYPQSSKKKPNKVLTDGVSQSTVSPTFWTNGESLGWMNKNQIEINVDFPKKIDVTKISLNTANGENAGVYYPNNIHIFSSSDKKTYKYLGDLVAENNLKNARSKSVTNLTLKDVNINAKYFKFIIIPKRNYFFVDEIQIFSGRFFKQKLYENINKHKLVSFIDDLAHTSKVAAKSEANNQAKNYLRQFVKKGLLVEHVDITDQLRSSDVPEDLSSVQVQKKSFVGEWIINTFRITNNTNSKKTISFTDKSTENKGEANVFVTHMVTNTNAVDVFDVLIPKYFPTTLTLDAGEVSYIVVRTRNVAKGDFKYEYLFTDTSGEKVKIILNHIIYESPSFELNGNSWVYFNYPQIANIKKEVLKDVQQHGINTFPIPRDILGKIDGDINGFQRYVAGIPKGANILLFFNFGQADAKRIGGNHTNYLGEEWKQNFRDYLKKLYKELHAMGYSNIYLYPYDEVAAKDLDDFKILMKWLRKDLGYKTFTTILSSSSLEAADYVDIVQINRKLLANSKIESIKSEKWIYDIMYYARDQNPASYRKLAWEAYYYGANGVGFWNYSQSNAPQNIYKSKYTNGRGDYSVIYNDEKGNILSSLRWEAFYLGFQDYLKLRSLENVRGRSWVRDFVKQYVIESDNQKDFYRGVQELDKNLP